MDNQGGAECRLYRQEEKKRKETAESDDSQLKLGEYLSYRHESDINILILILAKKDITQNVEVCLNLCTHFTAIYR